MMVAPKSATVSPKSYLLRGWAACSNASLAHLANIQTRIHMCNPLHMSRTSASGPNGISVTHANWFKIFGRPEFVSDILGLRSFRVSSGGGAGGGFGGSGNGKTGGGGDGDGDGSIDDGSDGSNWPLLSWYTSLLAKNPVTTKAVTSALLNLTGDLICQIMIDKVPSPDLKRIFIFTLLGFVLVGPTLHFWYLHLSQLMTHPGASGAFLRLLLDQFIFSPLFVGVFLSAVMTLEGRPSDVIPKLKQEWLSSVIANWQLWIPFQFLNFRFMPQQFQVLGANFIALIWNIILSYKAHKEVLAK